MKEKLIDFWALVSKPIIFLAVIAGLGLAIILPGLKAFRSLASTYETADSLKTSSFDQLMNTASFLPQRSLQALLYKLGFDHLTHIRLISVMMAVVALVAFFFILRHWYTTRVSLLGTFLLGSSSWFLHQARSAEVGISYILTIVAVISIGIWASERKKPGLLPVASFVSALTLYTPGVWVFFVISIVAGKNEIKLIWSKISPVNRLLSVVAFTAGLLPMMYSLYKNIHQEELLGLTGGLETLNASIISSNLLGLPRQLLMSGIDDPSRWLVGTPIFDVATATLIILGVYAYRSGLNPIRARGILIGCVLSVAVIGFAGDAGISLLVPFLYLLGAGGIGLLLQQWFSVFPKNPVARTIGVIWLSLLIVGVGYYQASRHFVGWPNAQATKQSMVKR